MLKKHNYLLFILLITSLSVLMISCKTEKNQSLEYTITNNDIQNKKTIAFLGDSITYNCDFNKLYPSSNDELINFGIMGDSTFNILNRIDSVISKNFDEIFLLIGINDLLGNYISFDESLKNYEKIINKITSNCPNTKLYIESVLPVNEKNFLNKNSIIEKYNKKINELSKKYNLQYIDFYTHFFNNDSLIYNAYLNDGLHLSQYGYDIIKSIQEKYLNKVG